MIYHYRYSNANRHGPTGREAAARVGVSRRTIYRWLDEGRLPYPITWEALEGLSARPRSTKRNPKSKRYTIGRHRFEKASV